MINYLIALRPWTWTAAIIPTVLVSTLIHVEKLSITQNNENESTWHLTTTLKLLFVFVCIQSGANAVNTVEDYRSGVDKKTNVGGDRALVDDTVNEKYLVSLAYSLLAIGTATAWSLGFDVLNYIAKMEKEKYNEAFLSIAVVLISGILLSIFYSASPFRFKYRALGDLVIFLCFGPLLMTFCSFVLSGASNFRLLFPYSVPVGVLTEAILHANNARDIVDDRKAGITTLAMAIGFPMCRLLYVFLIASAYITVFYLAFFKHTGLFLVVVTIPLAMNLIRNFDETKIDKMACMDEETAKFHLPFGLLMSFGLIIS